jgi:hypothetical protein
MEKDQDLKKLFKAFEDHAPELISVEAAEKIILQKHHVKPHISRKIMQTTFIATIGLTLSWCLIKSYTPSELNKPSNTTQIQSSNAQINDELENTENKTISINEPSSNPSPAGSSFASSNQVDVNKALIIPNISNPISNIEYDSVPYSLEFKDTAKTTVIENAVAIKKSKYNFIKLNEEELYKLGIVSRDGGVFYEETFNTKNPFKYSLIKSKNYQSASWEGGSLSILSNMDKYPKLITNLTITSATGILNRASIKDTLEIYSNYNYYIPIVVPLSNTSIDSSNAEAEIFWFPKSAYIKNLLPVWAQNELSVNPNAYSWDTKENRKYKSSFKSYGNASEKDISITLVEANKYLDLEPNQMKNFGFKVDTAQQSEIKIKAMQYSFQSYFKNGVRYNEVNCKNEKAFLKAKQKFKYPFPLYMTDSSVSAFHGDIISLKNADHSSNVNETQILLLEKSKLIPIKIQLSKSYHQYFWYEYDEFLLKALNEQQITIAQEILKDSLNPKYQMTINSQIEDVKLEEIHTLGKSKSLNIHPLKINENTLEVMGYKNVKENLEITLFDTLNKAIKLTLYKHGTTIDNVAIDTNDAKNLILPEYISNDLGKYTYVSFKTNAEKDASKIDFNQLIPVLFETKRSYNAIDLYKHAARPNYLLWFKPTPEFLKLLPVSEQVQIKSELDSTHRAPCVYSDVCRENKVNILKAIAYPNPNKGIITLKVDLLKPIDYSYSIADLSGKTLLQNQVKYQEENNAIDIDLSNLDNGIYYLYVYSNTGDLIVQKIVVMK